MIVVVTLHPLLVTFGTRHKGDYGSIKGYERIQVNNNHSFLSLKAGGSQPRERGGVSGAGAPFMGNHGKHPFLLEEGTHLPHHPWTSGQRFTAMDDVMKVDDSLVPSG